MIRTLAGVHDPLPGRQPAAARAGVVHALGEVIEQVTTLGPVTAAATGPALPEGQPANAFCLLDGRLYELDRLARDAGAAPDASPEAVITAAYARWGEAMLDGLGGEFVLLVWDQERGRGVIARDPLGTRPLFWHAAANRLSFASEVRPLLRLLSRRPGPDPAAVVQWLGGWRLEDDRTLYEGVRRLGAGHYLRLTRDGWTDHRYWAPSYRRTRRRPREEILEELRLGIERSVKRRLSPDGVNAVMLSGGLDSSSVAGVAAGAIDPGTNSLHAYSAVFPDHPSVDESGIIDRFTRGLGLPSIQMAASGGSALAGALEYLQRWEVPPKPPLHFLWRNLLARAAEDGVTMVLDGEGGDELFGPARYLIADRLRHGRAVSAVRLARRLSASPGELLAWRLTAKMVRRIGGRGVLPHAVHAAARRIRDPEVHVPQWFTRTSSRLYRDSTDPWAWKLAGGPRWWADLASALTSRREDFGVHDYLRRTAEGAGVQIRHPFMDLDLVELMLSLQPEESIDPRFNRPLLRESLKGVIPDEVRLRTDKAYFDPVWQEAVVGRDLEPIRRLLSAQDAEIRAYVAPDLVRSQLLGAPEDHPRGRSTWAMEQWRLATVECWLRAESESSFCERLLENWRLERPSCRFRTAAPAEPARG